MAEFVRVTNTRAVMEFLGGVQEPDSFHAAFLRAQACQNENGHCFWIVERRSDAALLGFCGLKIGNVGSIVGEIEIGWRLREDVWGQGYAREAASACLEWAWNNLSCRRVVAVTVQRNERSWSLMERLGMHREVALDFDHPQFPQEHPLRRHIAYTVARPGSSDRVKS